MDNSTLFDYFIRWIIIPISISAPIIRAFSLLPSFLAYTTQSKETKKPATLISQALLLLNFGTWGGYSFLKGYPDLFVQSYITFSLTIFYMFAIIIHQTNLRFLYRNLTVIGVFNVIFMVCLVLILAFFEHQIMLNFLSWTSLSAGVLGFMIGDLWWVTYFYRPASSTKPPPLKYSISLLILTMTFFTHGRYINEIGLWFPPIIGMTAAILQIISRLLCKVFHVGVYQQVLTQEEIKEEQIL